MEDLDEPGGEREEPGGLTREEIRAPFCRDLARQTLQKFGITAPPVPVEDLAKQLGFAVQRCPLPAGVDARLRIIDSTRIIELAVAQSPDRHRFSLAHEIGHDRLGHHRDGTQETKLAERQANLFAGSLLVPAAWLRRDIATYRTIPALIERYQVGRQVMFIAVKDARLLGRVRV